MRRFLPKNYHVDKAARGLMAGGVKYKLASDGTVYDRKTNKIIGMVIGGDLDVLFKINGMGLDNSLKKYLAS